MKKGFFCALLHELSQQSGEEKLRIAFKLNEFVRKLREQGRIYAKKNTKIRSGATS